MSYAFLLKYIVIGDSGVGKSCLLLQYTDKRYRQKHEVTIGVEFGAKLIRINDNNIKLQIWDTAGQQSFKAITRGYYRNAIGAIVCYDVCSKQSFTHVVKWLEEAKSNGPSTLNFILIGNKNDKTSERKVTYEEGLRFAKQQNIAFLQTSAKTGSNVNEIFSTITQTILSKIENKTIQVNGHPGIKIGTQKFISQIYDKIGTAQTIENIRIGKKSQKNTSKCYCNK